MDNGRVGEWIGERLWKSEREEESKSRRDWKRESSITVEGIGNKEGEKGERERE